MEISRERYRKGQQTMTLVFGMGRGSTYYVTLDDVVIDQSTVSKAVWAAGLNARAGLISCGWKLA